MSLKLETLRSQILEFRENEWVASLLESDGGIVDKSFWITQEAAHPNYEFFAEGFTEFFTDNNLREITILGSESTGYSIVNVTSFVKFEDEQGDTLTVGIKGWYSSYEKLDITDIFEVEPYEETVTRYRRV